MSLPLNKSVTLAELLITIVLLSVVVLSITSIDLFSRQHVISSDRCAQTQNELSYVLEHMGKEITKAIGNAKINRTATDGDEIIKTGDISGDTSIRFYVDANSNGQRDDDSINPWRAYRYRPSTATPSTERYQIWYCPNCTTSSCDTCNPAWGSSDYILSKKIIVAPSFTYIPSNDYVEVQLTACWDPTKTKTTADCGTPDNPSVTMRNHISMPSVSTN